MLSELSIKNFAIIDHLTVSFEKGLTVITGETGAGKSIIIDAIQLLIGGRGSAEYVRHGEKKAEIEGLFQMDEQDHPVYEKMEQFGFELEDGMIVLHREIFQSGKSVCRVNGKLVTISILREIGGTLVDIHGQHEHQALLDESKHLSLLDHFAAEKITPALKEYKDVYERYQKTMQKLRSLTENEQQMAQRLDLLTFQMNEIQQAQLQLHEDEQLNEEKRKLSNFEKIFESLSFAYNGLQGEQKGLDWIGLVMSNLEDVANLDSSYKELFETVSNSFYMLEELASSIRDELDRLHFNPERLNEVQERLNEINLLKRKYGSTIEEILEYGAKIEEELETLQNREGHIEQLESQLSSIKKDLLVEAKELTNIRKKFAKLLTQLIEKELKELYMEKTKFEVKFSNRNDFSHDGMDIVEFYISPNKGEPLKPLSKIASGGELSRIILALKTIFAKYEGKTSIVFDEVDTGVSGRVAQAIAEKIYHISTYSQVLCITHLPQVAAMADTHMFISKKERKGRTTTSVSILDKDEKIKEISRMISGVEITDITREHAKELLQLANNQKNA